MPDTMYFTVVRQKLFLVVHTKDNPDEKEWADYLGGIRSACGKVDSILIISDGGGPNTMQRGQMNDLLDSLKFQGKVAVVTINRIVRGIVTAISWFNPTIKAFSTIQIPAALKYLDIPETQHDYFNIEIKRLKTQLGITS